MLCIFLCTTNNIVQAEDATNKIEIKENETVYCNEETQNFNEKIK